MFGRYLPNLLVTLELAALRDDRRPRLRLPVRLHPRPQGPLPDHRAGVHGVPDVRGPVHRLRACASSSCPAVRPRRSCRRSGIANTDALFSLPSVVFAMAIFTFPFMVMNIGTALEQRRPDARGGGRLPRRPPVADVPADPPAAHPGRNRRRHADGLRLEHRDVRRAAAARVARTSSGPSPGRSTSAASSRPTTGCRRRWAIVLLVLAFVVSYLSLRYSRGALVE